MKAFIIIIMRYSLVAVRCLHETQMKRVLEASENLLLLTIFLLSRIFETELILLSSSCLHSYHHGRTGYNSNNICLGSSHNLCVNSNEVFSRHGEKQDYRRSGQGENFSRNKCCVQNNSFYSHYNSFRCKVDMVFINPDEYKSPN